LDKAPADPVATGLPLSSCLSRQVIPICKKT